MNPSISLRAPDRQGVTFVELFFDLVFVFAVTNVTGLVLDNISVAGAWLAVLVFWMIWWAWTQFTWALNPADTNHKTVRIATLVATGVAFVMAIAVKNAYDGINGLWFVVPYIVVRVIGLGLYLRVTADDPEQKRLVQRFAYWSIAGLTAALVGGIVEQPLRQWFWLLAVILDLVAAHRSGKNSNWGIAAGHFAERHGLIIIIVLGESLIATGIAALKPEHSFELFLVASGAVITTCLLWWLYFGWLKDGLEHILENKDSVGQTLFARDGYTILHFPMVSGVIAIAVGMEEMVAHPFDELHGDSIYFLLAGICLFVGSGALSWLRGSGKVLVPRILILVALTAGVLFGHVLIPRYIFLCVIVALGLIVFAERGRRHLQVS